MPTIDPSAWLRQVRPIVGVLKTPVIRSIPHEEPRAVVPFLTISRQAGAGARELAHRLVERLNAIDPGEVPWTAWDRELVEKVAADHNISRELVESLEERDHSWLSDFLAGLSISSDAPSEEAVFRDVSTTVRALAQAGRVVIVGMGAVFVTRNLPGAVHVRLVAPHAYRVDSIARRMGLTREQAEVEVKRLDRNRQAFYDRHWPSRKLEVDQFHLTLNVARLTESQMVECIVPLLTTKRPPTPTQRLSELAGV